ncbi:filamentous haemagglutinin family protein [Methylicorpusculum sp.]|uniref:filamentous haemagglutinin family protein n=1 Tax=Methylicorpusculum sp. TaxID=2713644 RepID=UPI0027303240|nr:filamentous haemagglutinin family protein [Methylicorpusculum sp.]MDP2177149.1 filamentous hemagglutinin family protein [Methylicorpusculum sp.]MDP3531292.1 filamentous hemagglutinin family protein [Methylicorpusculum sp.]
MANSKRINQSGYTAVTFRLKPTAACVRVVLAGAMVASSVAPVQAELPVPSAVWASMGSASRQVLGNQMRIDQHTDRAILNWESFNIGKENSVHFQQPGSTSIALNKIFQNDPSRILGALTANGQVYLVNRNGFVFGKDSRVDVRGLVASTLDVSDEVFTQGITKVFANSGTAAFQGNKDFYLKNSDGSFKLDTNGNKIKSEIRVEEGAKIKSGTGERILIMAPSITNEGYIESNDGQVILAAATDKVYLQEAGANDDVRGLLVEVETGGEINNLGEISSKRGNVTLIGFAVNQKGKASATTSLNLNGTVKLLAREKVEVFQTTSGYNMRATSTTRANDAGDGLGRSATVKFGNNSVTEVLPELDGVSTTIDEQIQPLSKVSAMGHKIHVENNAKIIVPGGNVDMVATQNPVAQLQATINRNDSRILVESGAKIDVSGIKTTVKPIESNIIEVELRLNQLKDSPLQRDGILFGKTILVDIRKGTPMTDIQPGIDAIQRTLGERLAKGGEINLGSEGDVIVQNNAVLDFSGGAVTYLDGFITTTKLTSNGRIFDISKAHPSLKYDGIYGEVVKVYEKWGVKKVWKIDGPFSLARREAGYIEGHDAGRLVIKSPNLLLEGQLIGGTVSGRLQRTLDSKARGGELTIDMRSASSVAQSVIFSSTQSRAGVGLDIDDAFPVNNQNLAVALALQSGLIAQSGIQNASFLANGSITVAGASTVRLSDGGHLNLQGGSIAINGNIKGVSANVSLKTETIGALDGSILIGQGSTIDLQGGWVNDLITPFASIDKTPISIKGGTFSAKANGDITLKAGSEIDVSGGAWKNTSGNVEAGDAGKVQLVASGDLTGSNITLNGLLKGYGLKNGGTLELEANAVAIRRRREDEIDDLRPLQIQDDFFGKGGFANYLITANINGLTIDEGARINLQQVNRILNGNAINTPNADSIAAISMIGTLPPIQRAPSSLVLSSVHSTGPNLNSHLIVGKNALINADPLSLVTLKSDTSIYFDGGITARGGDVSFNIIPPQGLPDPLYLPNQAIWLGDNAKIDVSGVAITTVDALGRRIGEIYDGGNVTLDAVRGFVATKAASLINVSGTAGQLNLARINPNGFGLLYEPITVGSHGGVVSIAAAEGLFLEGQMIGKGGNAPGTAGGTLSVSLDGTRRDPDEGEGIILNFPTAPGIMHLTQNTTSVFSGQFEKAGDTLPVGQVRKGYLSANQVEKGGFASLNVLADDEIRFQGDLTLNLQRALVLNTPKLNWQRVNVNDSGNVSIRAAHASLGSSRHRTAPGNSTFGDGILSIDSDFLEIYGGSYTTGIKQVNLKAGGDIRLRGTRIDNTQRDFIGEFKTFSELNLTSDQLYPSTLTQFSLSVAGDPNGNLKINGGDQNRPVLSAYSKLTIKAPHIEQNGTIKAPFGEIVMDAANSIKFGANSLTSVSAEGQIIPFGITEGGLEWLYPMGDRNIIVQAPPKTITVKSDRIMRDEGAVIDLSGGGDVQAYEFIPGIGGSRDVLVGGQSFAVIPGMSDYSPFDPLAFSGSDLAIGESVYLGSGSGLSAGYYTLLPARYALLPGAYLITPQQGTRDMIPGTTTANLEGAPVVAGFRSVTGASISDQRWSGFAVEPGTIALTRSQLDLTRGNQFFAQKAIDNETAMPRLPKDAGHLIFDAKTQLDLPTVRAVASNGGLAGLVDIVADNLAVVKVKNGASNTVQLLVSDLGTFEVGSLVLGAVRTFDNSTGAIKIDVKSKTVTLEEDALLEGSEIMLAATDKVELKQGASIVANGNKPANDNSTVLETTGDGALLRVSTGLQAIKKRTGSQGIKGDLIIGDGAQVAAATGSVLLDSTRQLKMSGQLEAGSSLNIGAESINLGEVDGSLNGLSLDNTQLSNLNTKELVLTSRSNVNLFGSVFRSDAQGNALTDQEGRNLPVMFENLIFDAAGLAGFGNDGKSALISAGTITLRNSSNVNAVQGNGSGELIVSADDLHLENGNFRLSGFGATHLSLSRSLTGNGESKLTSLGDLQVSAGYLTGATGSRTTIDASGHSLILNTMQPDITPERFGISAELNLEANAILIDTGLWYKAGKVSAEAKSGSVNLGENALIDVSGVVVKTGPKEIARVSAGQVALKSQQHDVMTDAASQIRMNGFTENMRAGELILSTAQGKIELNGAIDAHALNADLGGRMVIDTGNLGAPGFSGLSHVVADSGFTGGVDLRVRQGNLTVNENDSLNARQIKLTVDDGRLTVNGTLDASGENGGAITLNSKDKMTLTSSARLYATADGAKGNGGRVRLSSVDGGGIEIQNGAQVDVSSNGGHQGSIHLRTDRLGADVNLSPIAADTLIGDSNVTVEAVKLYTYSNLNAPAINTIQNETATYMNGIALNDVIGNKFGTGYEIAPGIEIRSAGNLTLSSKWDLVDQRYGEDATPGFLTLRAAGNVSLQNDLTDAFKPDFINVIFDEFTSEDVAVNDMLQSGRSWSYNIVAGATNSADNQAVRRGEGDILLGNSVKVRTGTGDIDLHAGRDIVYGNNRTVVYTAGRPEDENRYGFNSFITGYSFYAEYPIEGGDITFNAGRDIKGAVTNQLVTDWLVRTGNWGSAAEQIRPTAWGIALSETANSTFTGDYRQNVGALGGGDVSIKAGRNVNDLSVVIPTTGKQVGQAEFPDDPFSESYLTNVVEVNGGGHLNINAGQNIAGGIFYVDGGTASLSAGNAVTSGSNGGRHPIIALGDAQFNITAVKDVGIEAVIDPMVLPQGKIPDSGVVPSSLFFRYSPESAVSTASLTGNIAFKNDIGALTTMLNQLTFGASAQNALRIYPATLKAHALNGDIRFDRSLLLFPSSQGQLSIFGAGNITTGNNGNTVNVVMSDADPALLPSVDRPDFDFSNAALRLPISGKGAADRIYSAVPNHINDRVPAFISSGGNIQGRDPLSFVLAKQTEVMAGNDIRNVSFQIQHNFEGSQSIINAGRDVKFDIARNPATGAIQNRVQKIEVGGPGQLTVLAGRNVDLGSSDGITTVGNQVNPALAQDGAGIDVIAGLAKTNIDAASFFNILGDEFVDRYQDQVTQLMQFMTGDTNLSEEAALEAFKKLSPVEQAHFNAYFLPSIRNTLNVILKVQGNNFSVANNGFDNATKAGDVAAAFAFKQEMDFAQLFTLGMIETVFPGTTVLAGIEGYSFNKDGLVFTGGNDASSILSKAYGTERNKEQRGDISMFFSRIHSTDGGDINLYAPNGGVNAGLAVNSSGAKNPSELGVVAVKKGAIHSFVRDDFQVNTTRVMTLGGGDIVIGATDGNIDAGRGAKTALASPPPIVRFDQQGNLVVEFPPAVAGSGIRANVAPDGTQGDALLFALQGIIDASEAGVGGKDVTVGATAIVGSDNIDVGGVSVGVPVASTGSLAAGLGNAGNVAAAVAGAIDSSADAAKKAEEKMASAAALGIISVDILGFGDDETN